MPDTTRLYNPNALAPDGSVIYVDVEDKVDEGLVDEDGKPVKASRLQRHLDQGWVKSEPKKAAKADQA